MNDELEKLRVHVFGEDSRVILDCLRDEFLCPRNAKGDLISQCGDEAFACVPFGAGAKEEKCSSEVDLLLTAFCDILLEAFRDGLRNG